MFLVWVHGDQENDFNVFYLLCDFFFCLVNPTSLKRTSPLVQHHRAAKIRPHYNHINDGLLSPNENHRSNELMSPEINSMLSEDRAHIRPKHDDG